MSHVFACAPLPATGVRALRNLLPRLSTRLWTKLRLGLRCGADFIPCHETPRDSGPRPDAYAVRAEQPRCSRRPRARSTATTWVNKVIYPRKDDACVVHSRIGNDVKYNKARFFQILCLDWSLDCTPHKGNSPIMLQPLTLPKLEARFRLNKHKQRNGEQRPL